MTQLISRTFIIALFYFLSAKAVAPLSLVESSSVFAIWPPTGVALTALLLYGYRSWAGIALGALLLNMTLTPFLPSLQIAVTNTLGPLLGAWIIFRFAGGYNFFTSLRSMFVFFIAITAASLVTAWGGSTTLLFHGFIGMAEHFTVSYTWFLGDLIGFLVITPLVIAIRLECMNLFFRKSWGESLLILLFIIGGGLVFFGPLGFFDQAKYPIAYMFFIPVLWASIRFGALGGSLLVVLTSLIVITGTVYGHGPFVRPDPNDTLLLLQGYVWFMGVIAFFTATILRQKEIIQSSLLTTRDELKASLRALESNTTAWTNAMDQINDVVYMLDLDRHLLRANKAFYMMMQTTPEEAVGKHIVEVVHPEGELIPCPVCQAQEDKKDTVITMETDHPDNPSGRPIEITVKMIHDFEQKPSAILMMIHDLSLSRKLDEELKLAATVFESTAEGLLITDAEKHILALNRAACEITGYAKEELIGSEPPLFMAQDGTKTLSQSIAEQIAEDGFWRGEINGTKKEGSPLPLWMHINTVTDKRGKLLNYVILFLDISDRKAAEASIREYQKGLEAKVREELDKRREQEQIMIQQSKLAAMGEMVGMIAHQWRQPLNALGLLIQDLKDAQEFGELDEKYLEESVGTTMRLVQHMSGTIDDFRSFFRQDNEKRRFDMREIIDGIRSVIGASLKNNGIELVVTDNEPITLEGYSREYMQVVLNIVNNAKDALKRSKNEEKWIRIEWEKSETGKTRLIISDNGGGIPEAILPKIYDPYFTTKNKGHGTGIGLYMSKMIIERHMNGILREENTDDGVRFIVEI